ncbi:hypothetical protein BCR35DRAFT_292361 [Leucosporidium creatinivorum]|uniref:COP9 signalosome complex subunit 4 n=1 Tax=Leucosporidium creatinivorum TaxID=106004 RepID=A0A1Y2EZ20_9BASI|nr:hypothetical protein BCR35DRAFT_292361 [Leucosporidium creatinivorum]
METQLQKIAALPQKDKTAACLSLLSSTLSSSSSLEADLTLFLDAVLHADFPQIVARQTLTEYVANLKSIADQETRKQVMAMSLPKMQQRVTTFEEQVCSLREQYAELLENDEEYSEAAKVLMGIPLESGGRSNEDKLRVYVRIVRMLLEEEDSVTAETFFNRATLIVHSVKDPELLLHFKLSQARMFDYNRRFAEAASKYHEISYIPIIEEGERIQTLGAAIICAVLAPAGPTRSRILSSLFRDERSPETEHFGILSKMFLDQMIRPDEVTHFASKLAPHQLARLAPTTGVVLAPDAELEEGKKGPETVLDRAVMEHNVLSASRVYNNITFRGLGLLLALRPSAAEAMARTMIQQGRLHASLDQSEGLIIFDAESKEGDGVVSNVAAAADEDEEKEEQGTAPATKRWDLQIRQTLQLTESIAARCEALLKMGVNGASAPAAATATA